MRYLVIKDTSLLKQTLRPKNRTWTFFSLRIFISTEFLTISRKNFIFQRDKSRNRRLFWIPLPFAIAKALSRSNTKESLWRHHTPLQKRQTFLFYQNINFIANHVYWTSYYVSNCAKLIVGFSFSLPLKGTVKPAGGNHDPESASHRLHKAIQGLGKPFTISSLK